MAKLASQTSEEGPLQSTKRVARVPARLPARARNTPRAVGCVHGYVLHSITLILEIQFKRTWYYHGRS